MARPTRNDYIDSILYGDQSWGINSIRYFFDNSFDTWTPAAEQAFRDALKSWSDVAAIDFRETFFSGSAEFVEYYLDDADMTVEIGSDTFGAHEVPWYNGFNGTLQGWFNWESFGWPGPSGYDADALQPGGLALSVMIHEIGHALGLAHPHDNDGETVLMPGVSASDDLGNFDLNQGVFTVMSYNDGWIDQDPWYNGFNDRGYNAGPGALDIAAIQYLYGADTSNKGGNTLYLLSDDMGWSSIWDTGGTDKIAYVGTEDVIINLRSALLDESKNAGGFLSYVKGSGNYGGYTIAGDFTDALADVGFESGVIIENATGGSGNDTIVGNAVYNVLRGMGGNDTIIAGGSRDKVLGGSGNDKVFGGGGNDLLYGEGQNDTLIGKNGKDMMFGGGGNDLLIANTGNDTMNGGTGRDSMRGGSGADRFIFRDGYDLDQILDFLPGVDKLSLDDALWAGVAGINTAQDVVDRFASVNPAGNVVFKFDSVDRLLLVGVDSLVGLADDIFIF